MARKRLDIYYTALLFLFSPHFGRLASGTNAGGARVGIMYLAPSPASGSAARCARWDPNVADAVGVSHDDGSFVYSQPGSRPLWLQLHTEATKGAAAAAGPPRRPSLVPVDAAWSHWAFLPGAAGGVLIVLRHTVPSPRLRTSPRPAALTPAGARPARSAC